MSQAIGAMEPATKEANTILRKVRKERNQASFQHELGRMDDATYAERVAKAKEIEGQVISEYNTRWNAVMDAETKRAE